MSVTATCHCGNISITAPRKPEYINECQCSICRRYASAWGYYSIDEVEIKFAAGTSTRKYIWGDRLIEFHFCEHCGCVCYWWPIEETRGSSKEMGINTNMMEPEVLARVERRRTFIDAD